MLWSLVKIVIFMALVALAALGAGFLMETDGGIQVTALGVEYTLGPLESVIALAVLLVGLWLTLKLLSLLVAVWRFLNGDETALSRYFDRNRERKGFQALSEGMMALASGEGRAALAKAEKAHKYLDTPELTDLLVAQAAELAGDRRKAEETYKKLLAHERTRFVGVRGIMRQKLEDGDTETAMKLAERAFVLKPRHEETQDVLLKLQAQSEDWEGARKTLSAKLKHGNLPRDLHRRRDAVLALSTARDKAAQGLTTEARTAAIEANRLSPGLTPAAVMAARAYADEGNAKYASKMLVRAWDMEPHPELAAAFAAIVPDETPEARIKRFSALTRKQPDHPETRMLRAELQIAAENFPEARRALGDLATSNPTTRAVTIMAAIERGEGASDTIVKGWLAKALSVSRGPQWVCGNCQHIHTSWHPVCENCDSFDTLSWTAPPAQEMSSATGVEMLPLIIGDKASSHENIPVEDAEIVVDLEPLDPDDAKNADKG